MSISSFRKLLENRNLWSIGVFRYERLEDIFSAPPAELVHFEGATGLRVNKTFQSTAADPFLFAHNELLYLFYEVKTDHGHGTIHAQSMSGDGRWQSHGLVLTESFHLSYPQVFTHSGGIFMVPEAAQSGGVRLYEAVEFPYRWRLCKTLVDGPLRDPTLLITEDKGIFIFSTTAEYELKLYHSDAIERPFRDTGLTITHDPSVARCAGGVFKLGNQYFRPAQDCSVTYGKRINFQTIETLSPSAYSERHSGLTLQITATSWMKRGSHHISCERFSDSVFVAIDGRSKDVLINSFALGFLRLYEKLNFK